MQAGKINERLMAVAKSLAARKKISNLKLDNPLSAALLRCSLNCQKTPELRNKAEPFPVFLASTFSVAPYQEAVALHQGQIDNIEAPAASGASLNGNSQRLFDNLKLQERPCVLLPCIEHSLLQ